MAYKAVVSEGALAANVTISFVYVGDRNLQARTQISLWQLMAHPPLRKRFFLLTKELPLFFFATQSVLIPSFNGSKG